MKGYTTKLSATGGAVIDGVAHTGDADPGTAARPEGAVAAIVATFDDIDNEGDVVARGSVPDGAPVLLSPYDHKLVFVEGASPVGKGALYVDGPRLVFRGKFFMNTWAGREAFETVRGLGGQAQWSWAFRILATRNPTDEERAAGARRVLTRVAPFEVSPVMRAAGRFTRTISAKDAEVSCEYARFQEAVRRAAARPLTVADQATLNRIAASLRR
jgi:hypothetical protein